jgi:hypothetical protein
VLGQKGHAKQVGVVLCLQGDWHTACVWVMPEDDLWMQGLQLAAGTEQQEGLKEVEAGVDMVLRSLRKCCIGVSSWQVPSCSLQGMCM